jgi:hypothetical protein
MAALGYGGATLRARSRLRSAWWCASPRRGAPVRSVEVTVAPSEHVDITLGPAEAVAKPATDV